MTVVDQGAWQTLHGRPVRCAVCTSPFKRRDRQRAHAWYLGRMMDLFDIPDDDRPRGPLEAFPAPRTIVVGQRSAFIRGFEPGGEALGYMSLNRLYEEKPEQNIYDHQETGRPAFPLCHMCLRTLALYVGHRDAPAGGAAESASLAVLYGSLCRGLEADRAAGRPPGASCWVEEGWPEMARALGGTSLVSLPQMSPSSERLRTMSCSPIPSLPSYILSKLEPVPPADAAGPSSPPPPPAPPPPGSPVRARLLELPLPPEITQQVATFLDRRSRFALRLVCAGFAVSLPLGQAFWHDELLEGALFGFFFPFRNELHEVGLRLRKAGHVPSQWDWRSLVGRLARWSSFEEGGSLEDAPPAFRSRRRYWRLLELLESVSALER